MPHIVAGIRGPLSRDGRAIPRAVIAAAAALTAVTAIALSSCTVSSTTDPAAGTSPSTSQAGGTTATDVPTPSSDATASTTSQGLTSTSAAPTTTPATTPATATPSTTPAPADPRPLAIDLLATITVENERPDGYDRDLFDHWITQPSGCSTREAVLIRDAIGRPQVDPFGCTVVEGDWISAYDGAAWIYPSDVDIDHVVALKEAWDSGAWNWSEARRRAFANDLTDTRSLRAVTDNVNQSKSDQDPSNWMPPLRTYWCTYLGDWVAIKARWRLSMDQSEFGRVRNLLRDECPGWRIAPIAPPPA